MPKFKILTIVGARPQFIKAAALSRAFRTHFSGQIEELILHTGQHYDENMSEIFFAEMQIPKPDFRLQIGSSSHGKQTAQMMEEIEKVIFEAQPDAVMVYGDTNSTLAGALAASKLHIKVIHVEAGLRSFNKSMPEEINRICTDVVSAFLFCPTQTAVNHLLKEGYHHESNLKVSYDNSWFGNVGDVMYDNTLFFAEKARNNSKILHQLSLGSESYILATVHRDFNTDDESRLKQIFDAFEKIALQYDTKIVFPCHPRTTAKLKQFGHQSGSGILLIEPVSFFDMIQLEQNAEMIITDSGGVQKESYFFKKPCVVLRPETEWTEIIESGNGILADADTQKILDAVAHFKSKKEFDFPAIYGDGHASKKIGEILIRNL